MNTLRVLRMAMRAMVGAGLAVPTAAAFAQGYPARAITILVPFGPGSGNDVIARIVAQKVSEN